MKNLETSMKERSEDLMFLSGSQNRCIVYGCGRIFFKHYISWLAHSVFTDFIFVDSALESESIKKNIKEYFKRIPNKKISFVHNLCEKVPITESDYVFIFTNHRSHYKLIENCLKAKSIFVEKPIVLCTKNWEKLNVTRIQKANIWPAYHQFYTTLPEDIANLKDKPTLNSLRSIRIRFYASEVPLRAWGKSYTSKNLAGGGVYVDLGPHVLSILSILIPDICHHELLYTKVSQFNNSPDTELESEIYFEGKINHCLIEASIGYVSDDNFAERRIELYGQNKLMLKYNNGDVYVNDNLVNKLKETKLAFKNMLSDFIELKKPYYYSRVGWNIQSIQNFYEHLGKEFHINDET